MSKRHRALIGLALCGAPLACDNSGLLDEYNVGQAGTSAQSQGGSGAVGGAGASAQGGSGGAQGGSGGNAGSSSAGSAGTGNNQPVVCPADDGTAAALTLAGLGLQLPGPVLDAGVF